ncbi:hypothetical protein [Streptomyces triticiradicis]|uniref:hypothetical protein n=1 Tax=Streptomyces triticiradicis TaxID=2651189 RepID=UPI001CED4984|nr:hypothetical protein [Streptomyces triticiradicis]
MDELEENGTVPQYAGGRVCSQKRKAWTIDRHQLRRAGRRQALRLEHPLLKLGWGRVRLSTRSGLSARVHPDGRRTARIGVFAPLVHLWHTDIEAARAALLHELGHLRRGEQHVTGLGSPFTALVRVWPYVLAGFVVLPVTLPAVTGNATAVLVCAEVVLVLEGVPKVLLLVVAALWSAELGADRFAARTAGADTVVGHRTAAPEPMTDPEPNPAPAPGSVPG